MKGEKSGKIHGYNKGKKQCQGKLLRKKTNSGKNSETDEGKEIMSDQEKKKRQGKIARIIKGKNKDGKNSDNDQGKNKDGKNSENDQGNR